MTESEKKQVKKGGFFRGVTRTFFNLPRWINVKQYRETNKTLVEKVKDTFRIAQAHREETFEQAMQRLQVTEKDLQERMVANQRALYIILAFIGFLCLYVIYLLFHGAFLGVVLALAVIALSAVRAFQYSFWNFQIKHKKLGCSFSDWLSARSVKR